jgi:CRP-like cAMP-binding protein
MNPAELFRHETGALQLAPGDSLFREGDKGEKSYVLLEGDMEILLGDFVLANGGPGALIGEMALIGESQRTASAVAKTAAGWQRSIDGGSIFSFSRRRISPRT